MDKQEKLNDIDIKYSAMINDIKYEIWEIKDQFTVAQGFSPIIVNEMIGEKYNLIDRLRARREDQKLLV